METTTDTSGHVETSQVVSYSCGNPNHTAKSCVASGRGRGIGRGGQILFNSQPKKLIKPHTSDSPDNSLFFNMHHSCNFHNENLQCRDEGYNGILDDEINEVITLEGEILMYIPLKFENIVRRKTFVDGVACANAMPADFFEKLKDERPSSISELQQAPFLYVKVA